jgi:hypothetical protein
MTSSILNVLSEIIWQEEKALKAAEEPGNADELAEEERKKAEAEQRRRMDQQYQKLVAYLWRMEQETAKVAAETADEYLARLARKEKSQSGNSRNLQLMAEQRQERDRQWLEQRRRQLLTRQQQQQQQQQPPKVASLKRAVSVPRDPQRLLRPTSAYMARLLPAAHNDDAVPSVKQRPAESYILDVQSKSVHFRFILLFLRKYRAISFEKRQLNTQKLNCSIDCWMHPGLYNILT